MPKIEYGDLYKFIVSIGVLLIGLAFVLPWLLLRESFDLLIPMGELSKYTPTAQHAILQRQYVIDWYSHLAFWISGTFLALGTVTVGFGLYHWWTKSQRHIDKKTRIDSETIISQAKSVSDEDLISTAQREIDRTAAVPDGEGEQVAQDVTEEVGLEFPPNGISEAQQRLWYQESVATKLNQCLDKTHEVLVNQEIQGARYDFVAIAKNEDKEDILAEIAVIQSVDESTFVGRPIFQGLNLFVKYRRIYTRDAFGLIIFLVVNDEDAVKVRMAVNEFIAGYEMDDTLIRVYRPRDWQKLSCDELQDLVARRRFMRWLA